jgi:hypothetical protein
MSVEGKYVGNYEISMDGIRVISASRLLPNPWKVLAVSIFPIISFIVSCFMFISFVFDKIRHRI